MYGTKERIRYAFIIRIEINVKKTTRGHRNITYRLFCSSLPLLGVFSQTIRELILDMQYVEFGDPFGPLKRVFDGIVDEEITVVFSCGECVCQ